MKTLKYLKYIDKETIINFTYIILMVLNFVYVKFWLAIILFFVITLSMVLYRLFLTEIGKSVISTVENTVKYYKLKDKIKKEGKNENKK